jgi:hypothetical protein
MVDDTPPKLAFVTELLASVLSARWRKGADIFTIDV